jgi:hypothetical protein
VVSCAPTPALLYLAPMRPMLTLLFVSACASSPSSGGGADAPYEASIACETRYDDTNATRANEEAHAFVRTVMSRVRARASEGLAASIDFEATRVADLGMFEGVARERADVTAQLAASLGWIPGSCDLTVFVEPGRIDIPPAMVDTPEDRVPAIDAARDVLMGAEQLVVTCGGCPVAALARTRAGLCAFTDVGRQQAQCGFAEEDGPD